MSRDFYARKLITGDLGGDNFAVLSYASSKIVKAAILGLSLVNNPSFSGLTLKIYAYDAKKNEKGGLLYSSSTSYTLSSLKAYFADSTKTSARVQVPFEFAEIILKAGVKYAFSLEATSYTGTNSSFMAWNLDYPDRRTTNEGLIGNGNLSNIGLAIGLIGDDV